MSFGHVVQVEGIVENPRFIASGQKHRWPGNFIITTGVGCERSPVEDCTLNL